MINWFKKWRIQHLECKIVQKEAEIQTMKESGLSNYFLFSVMELNGELAFLNAKLKHLLADSIKDKQNDNDIRL